MAWTPQSLFSLEMIQTFLHVFLKIGQRNPCSHELINCLCANLPAHKYQNAIFCSYFILSCPLTNHCCFITARQKQTLACIKPCSNSAINTGIILYLEKQGLDYDDTQQNTAPCTALPSPFLPARFKLFFSFFFLRMRRYF